MEEHLTLASHYLFVSRLAAHSKKLSRIVGDRHDNFFHFDGETGLASDLSANPPPLPRGIFLALLHLISLTLMGVPSEISLPTNKPDIRQNLAEEVRWSQIRLELPLEQEGGKQIRLELPS